MQNMCQDLSRSDTLSTCVRSQGMLQDMIKRQMAFEHIFAAEGLTVSDAEIQQEYDGAAREFNEQKQEFDQDRLHEQVVETLKVRASQHTVMQSPYCVSLQHAKACILRHL